MSTTEEQELAWWEQQQWQQQPERQWRQARRWQQLYLFDGPFEPEDL